MQRILIVDGSAEFSNKLANNLDDGFHVRVYIPGENLIDLILEYAPDILVIDLMLPGWDGIAVLEMIEALGARPTVLAISRVAGHYVQESLDRLGITYLMTRPCVPYAVAARLRDIARYRAEQVLSESDEKEVVVQMLHDLGLTEAYMGFACLSVIIPWVSNDPKLSYTKSLYPDAGKLLNCSAPQVERGVRTAIQAAWVRRQENIWQHYFSGILPGKNSRPSNKQFISRLAQLLSAQKKQMLHL